jgi:hypothetical protein
VRFCFEVKGEICDSVGVEIVWCDGLWFVLGVAGEMTHHGFSAVVMDRI